MNPPTQNKENRRSQIWFAAIRPQWLRSLQFWLPALLSLLAIGCGLALYGYEARIHRAEFEADFNRNQAMLGTRMQAEVDRWVQRNELDGVQSILVELATIPELTAALFLDATNTVRASTRRENVDRPLDIRQLGLDDLKPIQLLAALQTARRTRQGSSVFTSDRNGVIACYPSSLPMQPGELEVRRGSMILVAYDLRRAKSASLRPLQKDFLTFFAGILATALALGVSLHFLITRKRAEQSVALMNVALNNVHESAFLIGSDSRFQYVNDEACRVLGYSRAELVGMGVPDIDPDFPFERWLEIWNALKAHQSLTFETRHRTKDGRMIPVEIVALHFEYDGQEYNMALARNITERKLAQEKLTYLASIVESSDDAIIGKALDETILSWNRGAERIYGYTAGEIVGRSVSLLVPAGLEQELAAIMEGLKRGEIVEHLETTRRRKDGQIIHVALTISPIKDTRGQIVGASTIARDMTERKRVEEALVFVAQRGWQISGDNFFDALAQFLGEKLDMDYVLIDRIDENPDMAETVALYAKGAVTPNLRYALKGTPCENVMGRRLCVYPQGIQQLFPEDTLLPKMGAESYIGIPLWDSTGRPVGLIAVMGTKPLPDAAPVTQATQLLQLVASRAAAELERRRAEERLRRSEQGLLAAQRIAHLGNWELDLVNNKLTWSDEIYRIFEMDPAKFGASYEAFLNAIHPEDRGLVNQAYTNSVKDKTPYDIVHRLQMPDGRIKYVNEKCETYYDLDGQPLRSIGTVHDITERKRAEESNKRLATAVEQSAEAIVITDADGTIVYGNPAFEKSTGYSMAEAIGKKPSILKSGRQDREFYRRLWDALARGEVWQGHFHNKRKDGTLYEEEAIISPIRNAQGAIINYVAVKRDVTREVRLETQLRQMQKMEGIGQLAGGVAHDFNNILTSLMMQAELAAVAPDLPGEIREYLASIKAEVDRAANLTRQLLLFSRKQVMQPRPLDLNEIVISLAKMLQRIIREDVSLELHLYSTPLMTYADAGMLDQVLMNLAVNARDAMPNGGKLIIETAEEVIDAGQAAQNPEASPGQFVRLSVSDTGCGMTPEIQSRIFEPFFTTKEAGKGTGLGLATVFGIVKQHHGWLKVCSEVGKGTTFQVFLPATEKSAEAPNQPVAKPKPRGGSETILLAEDNDSVRALTRILLERNGYQVLEVADGVAAQRVWAEHQARIALLLTDLIMPGGVDGRELAARLQRQKPALKVIFTTGYSADIGGQNLKLQAGQNFVQKPCPPDQLLQAVRDCLDD